MSLDESLFLFTALYLLGAVVLLVIALGLLGASTVACVKTCYVRERSIRFQLEVRLDLRKRMSIGEMLGLTAVLALDFAWFPGWLAIVLAPVVVLAMRHALRERLRSLEVLSSLATVVTLRAGFVYVEQTLIPPWYNYEQYVCDCVVLTLLFLGGILYSLLPLPLCQRALQVIATTVLTALMVLLLDEYQRHFQERPPLPVLFLTLVPTVVLARYRDRYNLQVRPSAQAKTGFHDRLLRVVLASCLIVVTWFTYRLIFPRLLW